MAKYKLVNTLTFGDVAGQVLIWVVLSVFTFGVALLFSPYFFVRLIINHTEVHQIGWDRKGDDD